ncbi:fad binding domain-containing [Lecanosticta acicola]|uniref:Fad binding domain-containing n=1 Tax=Lecanosticta acicola TaxID=111012 RepID=A0AAI8YZ70_9PEZI|nr:fad binding domain-containing [Lecanosticta acicola]
MSTANKTRVRRHSFSAFGHHRHRNIPHSTTSHPDNPIPVEPARSEAMHIPLDAQVYLSNLSAMATSPRSSGDSLSRYADHATTTSSDSDSPSTPATERSDLADDSMIQQMKQLSLGKPSLPRKRRASTTYASNVQDIRDLIGSGAGTKFLQKYCCGEGCCMIESLPLHTDEVTFAPIITPSNDAYRFLNLDLRSLSLDTQLTKIVHLPEKKVSFGTVRRESITDKFPQEAQHRHDAVEVGMYPPEYMKPHPPYNIFNAPLYGARELTKPGAEKRTFHFDIDVTDYPEEGGVDFKVGGAVGVCPPNDPDVVEDIMNQLGIPRFQRDKAIRLHTTGGRWPTIWGDEQARELVTTRREVLTWTVDISSTAPTKPVLRLLAEYASDPNEKKILQYLCSAQGQATFCDLRTGPHTTLQQLLHAFPSAKPPLEGLCGVLTQLMPRFYSLSNDPHVSSAREGIAGRRLIEVAVTVHEADNYSGGKRTGVGSGFLERLAMKFIEHDEKAQKEAAAQGFTLNPGVGGRRLNLHLPMFRGLMSNPLSKEFVSDGPMVLIGAGVGMAPFRGFILNRLKNASCANKIWLIQGIRDSMLDEIYRGELGAHEKDIKKVVQSRAQALPPVSETEDGVDQPNDDESRPPEVTDPKKQNKVAKYVQDEVRMQADIVWFVINSIDGRIFVCGSTKGMGEGVEEALVDVAMDKGNLDYETAKQFWSGKKDAGQYIAETW